MKNFIILSLLVVIAGLGVLLNQEIQKNEPYVQTVMDLSDKLTEVTKQLNQSTCVIQIMTKIMQQDSNAINAIDTFCKNFREEHEFKACVKALIKDQCGMENY